MTSLSVTEVQEWLELNKPGYSWTVLGGNPVVIGLPCKDSIMLYYGVRDGSEIGGISDTCIRVTGASRAKEAK